MKALLILLLFCCSASAQTFTPVPNKFVPNTVVVPGLLMADFLSIIADGNDVVTNLNSKISVLSAIPVGVIVFFNLASCPSGWSAPAEGGPSFFVRGLDNGAGKDTTGTLLGGTETGGMQNHSHTVTPIATGTTIATFNSGVATFNPTSSLLVADGTTGDPITGSHGTEVRPENVSLLLCIKN